MSLQSYSRGLIVQTVGMLEDAFDAEAIAETQARHKVLFISFGEILRSEFSSVLPLGAGGCRNCTQCGYPDIPCRDPQHAYSSMEAYGMLVTDVCRNNGLPYYYGPNTIAYSACYLLS